MSLRWTVFTFFRSSENEYFSLFGHFVCVDLNQWTKCEENQCFTIGWAMCVYVRGAGQSMRPKSTNRKFIYLHFAVRQRSNRYFRSRARIFMFEGVGDKLHKFINLINTYFTHFPRTRVAISECNCQKLLLYDPVDGRTQKEIFSFCSFISIL